MPARATSRATKQTPKRRAAGTKPAYCRYARQPAWPGAGAALRGVCSVVAIGYAPKTSLKAVVYAASSPAGPFSVIWRARSGWSM